MLESQVILMYKQSNIKIKVCLLHCSIQIYINILASSFFLCPLSSQMDHRLICLIICFLLQLHPCFPHELSPLYLHIFRWKGCLCTLQQSVDTQVLWISWSPTVKLLSQSGPEMAAPSSTLLPNMGILKQLWHSSRKVYHCWCPIRSVNMFSV